MLKHGDINPLSVFGLRQIAHCPPHFERVGFDTKISEKQLTDWIFENLDGRFWIGDSFYTSGNNVGMQKCIGFESPGEASYFALMLDQINTYGSGESTI